MSIFHEVNSPHDTGSFSQLLAMLKKLTVLGLRTGSNFKHCKQLTNPSLAAWSNAYRLCHIRQDTAHRCDNGHVVNASGT